MNIRLFQQQQHHEQSNSLCQNFRQCLVSLLESASNLFNINAANAFVNAVLCCIRSNVENDNLDEQIQEINISCNSQ